MSAADPEPYAVKYSPRAERNLEDLPERVARVCVEYIAFRLVENPARLSAELTRPPLVGSRSARPAEGYRVVFSIDEESHRILIERVGPRGTVYRP